MDQQLCQDCSKPLIGRFCHECGQKALVHRSTRLLASEAVKGVLNADGRAYRTIRLLFVDPAALTWEYVSGRRTRYLSPILLFLFTSAIAVIADEIVYDRLFALEPPAKADETWSVVDKGLVRMEKLEEKYPFLFLPFFVLWSVLLCRKHSTHALFEHSVILMNALAAWNIVWFAVAPLSWGVGSADPAMWIVFILFVVQVTRILGGVYEMRWWSAAIRATLLFFLGMISAAATAAALAFLI